MKNHTTIRKMVMASLFAALTFVATLIHIHIPGAQTRYVNLGDCLVIICGILLGPVYGGLAAGIGSAFTDFIHGYAKYVLGTFVIKMLMAVAAYYIFKGLSKNKDEYKLFPLITAGIVSELIMVAGYFVYEGLFIVTFAGALAGVVGNCIQGIAGVVVSVIFIRIMKRIKITDMIVK